MTPHWKDDELRHDEVMKAIGHSEEYVRPTFEEEYTLSAKERADATIEKPKQVGGNHYIMPIEPIDYIVKNELGYREGNVVKYVSRHQKKNGAEDIKKAIHYLEMILKDYDETK